jgi:hypothetical protein
MATGMAIDPQPAMPMRKSFIAWVSLPSVVERRLKISAKELRSRATPNISSLVSSDKPAPSSSVGALLVRLFGAGLADESPLKKEGKKRLNPVFAPPLLLDAPGLAAPGAVLPPNRPKGAEPLEPDVAGLDPPTAGLVPVDRAPLLLLPPNGDELLDGELPDVVGFLSAGLAPPPKRLVIPPNNPPPLLLALGVAGLSPALAPPPKRLVIPLKPLVIPPPLLALGVAGLSPPPPPKRPVIPPNTPPDFFSSGLAAGLAELLPPGGAELAAGRLPPNCDPLELPELPLLPDPPPKDEPLLAGRLVGDELPELLPGELGLLVVGRLPPNCDDPPELPELPLLPDPPPKDEPLLAGRLPLPNCDDPPELLPGEEGLLPAGRLPPPNGDTLPLDGLEPPGVAGRLPPVELMGGRLADEAVLLGGGLVRPPEPGKLEVGRLPRPLLEPPNGFTRD